MTITNPAAPGRADALILFAHGARDAQWAAPMQAVAAAIGALQPAWRVRLACLDFIAPDLAQAAAGLVAEGARRVHVVPMFLGAGGHVRQDLPRRLEALRAAHPEAEFTLHPTIGEIDAIRQAMALAIVAIVEGAR